MSFARHGRRDPRAGRPRLPPPPVRPAARDPRPGDAAPAPRPRSTCFEVYNARLLFEALQRRGAPLRAQVRPDDGRRLRRARAPGRRHRRRCGCAPSTARRSSCSACARAQVLRRPKLAALPAVAEVGGAGQGKGPLGEKGPGPRGRRDHRRDLREVPARRRSPRSTSSAMRSRAPPARAQRAGARLRPSARGRLAAQVRAAAGGGAGGRRLLRPRRARRSSSRCSGCTSIRSRSTGRTASSSPTATRTRRAPWLMRELHIVQPKLVVVMGETRSSS